MKEKTISKLTKLCKQCQLNKSHIDFSDHKNGKDGKTSRCKTCLAANKKRVLEEKINGTYVSKCRQPRLSDEEKQQRLIANRQYHRQYRKDNAKKLLTQLNEKRDNARKEGIKAYGGCCQCCGEKNEKFLTLEHLLGRDKSKKRRTGKAAWNIARIEGYPKDKYTVLCFNCNCGKGVYGICPHKV